MSEIDYDVNPDDDAASGMPCTVELTDKSPREAARDAKIRAALWTLTDREREVIELTVMGGYTLARAATAMDISVRRARGLKATALLKLKELLS